MQKIDVKKMDALVAYAAELKQLFVAYDRVKDDAEAALNGIILDMNEKREAIAEALREAHGDADEYFADRSEKWQESDRGSAYQDWVSKLDQLASECEDELEQPSWEALDEPSWIGEVEDGAFGEPEY